MPRLPLLCARVGTGALARPSRAQLGRCLGRQHSRFVISFSLQCSRKFFPLLHQVLQIGLPVSKFLGLALRFFRAHKALELRFTQRDRGFGPGNLFFYFVQAVFHLLALDRVQALAFGIGVTSAAAMLSVSIHRHS